MDVYSLVCSFGTEHFKGASFTESLELICLFHGSEGDMNMLSWMAVLGQSTYPSNPSTLLPKAPMNRLLRKNKK